MKDTKTVEVPVHPTLNSVPLDAEYFRSAVDAMIVGRYSDALFAWDAAQYRVGLLEVEWLESGGSTVANKLRGERLKVKEFGAELETLRPFMRAIFEPGLLRWTLQTRVNYAALFDAFLKSNDFNSLHWAMSGLSIEDILPG